MPKILITTVPFGENNRLPLDLLESSEIEYLINPYNKKLTENQLIELIGGFDSELDCNNEPFCFSCSQYDGWYNDPDVDEMLTIEFSASFDNIGAVIAEVDIPLPEPDTMVFYFSMYQFM